MLIDCQARGSGRPGSAEAPFRSRNPPKAFFVDVSEQLNTVIFAGKLIARVGLATTKKPAEFIILRISRDTRALEAELAAAERDEKLTHDRHRQREAAAGRVKRLVLSFFSVPNGKVKQPDTPSPTVILRLPLRRSPRP